MDHYYSMDCSLKIHKLLNILAKKKSLPSFGSERFKLDVKRLLVTTQNKGTVPEIRIVKCIDLGKSYLMLIKFFSV
jgi:hypothetical protein